MMTRGVPFPFPGTELPPGVLSTMTVFPFEVINEALAVFEMTLGKGLSPAQLNFGLTNRNPRKIKTRKIKKGMMNNFLKSNAFF